MTGDARYATRMTGSRTSTHHFRNLLALSRQGCVRAAGAICSATRRRGAPPRLVRESVAEYPRAVGTIFYGGSATPIHIEDRALAHLKVVIATKLRRHESFTVSWRHPDGEPVGRSTIWLHPSIPLRFVFR